MKANELRIGNWALNEFGNPVRITSISSDENIPVQPIPITPEILEKAGFEFISDWDNTDKRKNEVCYFEDLGYMYIAMGMMGGVTLFQNNRLSTGVNIDYLHQLQNLYFALTGEELIINL